MAVTLWRGQDPLTKNDLNVYVLDEQGNYFNPFRITYTIYRVISDRFNNQECGEEPFSETIDSPGIPFGFGQFFAPWKMPTTVENGPYRIHWNIKQYPDSPILEAIEQFEIISKANTMNDVMGNSSRTGPFPHQSYGGGCPEGV
jgi:hypothetical protein